ncbi:MAG: DUF3488 domain-containing protein, partial [Planctomycetota bacterium]|nr:DUF3488 domain-containing protein [Planctomycetota bacterium]
MSLERLLQISVATLASLATLLLGMGQRSVAMPLIVVLAAFLSVWLADFTGWFRLKRIPAGIAAVVAMLFCLGELVPLHPATAIMTIARLLVYLQVILLFQKKDPRVYWQLIVLSLLQVVVATVFNQGFWFGLMMVVYLFTALLAMMLLCLLREEIRYRLQSTATIADRSAGNEPRGVHPREARTATADAELLSAVLFPGRELFARVAMLGLGTLMLTAVAFFTLPRLGQPAWRAQNVTPRRSVGYSNEVELGELGLIIENPEEVMRVQFADPDSGAKVQVDGEIYLQGAVLTAYKNGFWMSTTNYDGHKIRGLSETEIPDRQERPRFRRRRGPPRRLSRMTALNPLKNPPQSGVVRQTITIEPMDRRELFCLRPFFITQPNPSIQIGREDRRLLRSQDYVDRRFTFHLNTTAIVGGRQTQFVPVEKTPNIQDLLQLPKADSADASPAGESLPNLRALADRWMAGGQSRPGDWADRARYLKHRLDND